MIRTKLIIVLLAVMMLSVTVLEGQSRWLLCGRVSYPFGGIANIDVLLEIQPRGSSQWVTIETVTTDSNGYWTHMPDMEKYPYSYFSKVKATAVFKFCHLTLTKSVEAEWAQASVLNIFFINSECNACQIIYSPVRTVGPVGP